MGDESLKHEQDFLRKTRRHFAALRENVPGRSGAAAAFPDGWFDLSPDCLADFGAMYYLASLTPFNRGRSLAQVTAQLEPPLRLNQYRIFRSGGYPRAFITWAGLAPAAERRFAIDHQPLAPQDWNSGPSTWLIDFVAPFGQADQIMPMLMRNPALTRLRTLWHNKPGTRRRIIEWTRADPHSAISMTSYGQGQFDKLLGGP